ncbi:hypothetical protein BLOT_009159 [Blomia tropicalis]|nr:hypothetical protein BLOT_009159 [Blomia tropicalis]
MLYTFKENQTCKCWIIMVTNVRQHIMQQSMQSNILAVLLKTPVVPSLERLLLLFDELFAINDLWL